MKRLILPTAALPIAVLALALTAGGFAAATPEPAAPAAKAPRSCFFVRSVNNYKEAGDETVYIRVGVRDIYRLDLMGRCHDLGHGFAIGLDTRGSPAVCGPLDVTVVAGSSIGPQRCPVTAVTRLTPEQVAALPKKHRP